MTWGFPLEALPSGARADVLRALLRFCGMMTSVHADSNEDRQSDILACNSNVFSYVQTDGRVSFGGGLDTALVVQPK